MSELFNVPETLSPKMKWMRRHQLTIEIIDGQIRCKYGMDIVARGCDEMEVLANAATSLNIPMWNEEVHHEMHM